MKGLLLGAGASFEVGMPLVWEFSQTLRINILKRLETKLFDFNDDIQLKKYFIEILSDKNLHYEQVVGLLEKKLLNKTENIHNIHGIISQLIECIQLLLLEEQKNTKKLFSEKIKDYYGIYSLLDKENLLNIFTLNHDTIFEEILDYYKIPYKDGFYTQTNNYTHLANFKILTKEQIKNENLNIFKEDEKGINLIKLHGSLDIFAIEDKSLFLKVYGNSKVIGSYNEEIMKIENHSNKICQKDNIRITNELYVYDSLNELQFLRRSLLSGEHKFKNQFEQIIPHALLTFFKKQLKTTNDLTIIGYSFGDYHINKIIKNWLEDESNKVEIYDPYRISIPKDFLLYEKQFKIINGGLTDYFMKFDSSQESLSNKLKRQMLNDIRNNLKEKRLSSKD